MIQRRARLKRTRIRARRRQARRGPPGVPPEMWRNPDYLKFLAEWGACQVCIHLRRNLHGAMIDPAHGPVNGTSSKGPDAEAMPLCREHHTEQHSIGWPEFEAKYGFSRETEAARWWKAFLEQS